jgi:hypothetical protein
MRKSNYWCFEEHEAGKDVNDICRELKISRNTFYNRRKMYYNMDFTIKQYTQLLDSLQNAGFLFQSYVDFVESESGRPGPKETESPFDILDKETYKQASTQVRNHTSKQESQLLILRHDVDKMAQNSFRFAQIQAEKGVKGTYYFRMHSHSYNEELIKKIADLGHEIGYHYETMDSVSAKYKVWGKKINPKKGNAEYEKLIDHAYEEFCRNLEKFRKIADIKTISMHGSPMSPYDNRAIWQKYDYKKLGIIAEPYFDLDFNQIFYITDTGRRWDGHLFNVRDKATKENPVTNKEFLKLRFHSTSEIVKAVAEGRFPKQAMLNFHPQRWNESAYLWTKELILQNLKNQVKRFLVK